VTQRDLKKKLHELVGTYFDGLKKQGNIVWGKTKPVNPNSPMVALLTGPINRQQRPIRKYINGIVHDFWPSKTVLQVDLYTKGAPTSDAPNVKQSYENTAVNDLTDFVNFLHSVYVDHWSFLNDISINVSDVQDLTALTNNTSWSYRAMVEIAVGFTQQAVGHAMIMHEAGMPYFSNGAPMFDDEGYALDEEGNRLPDLPPLPVDPEGNFIYPPSTATTSGGRSQELANMKTGWFESVEVEYVNENQKEELSNGKQS